VTTRFLDTNEFALSDVPREERFIIGARTTGHLGARHDPEVALHALQESRSEVEELFSQYSIIILIGTEAKVPARARCFHLRRLRVSREAGDPDLRSASFEQHEVDKRHYDHAVRAIEQFDSAGIRLIEILNDRGYTEHDPQPQSIVWERMNVPFARGLRGLISSCGISRRSIRPISRSCLPARAVCESVSVRSILRTAPTRAINWWRPQPADAVTIRTTLFTSRGGRP